MTGRTAVRSRFFLPIFLSAAMTPAFVSFAQAPAPSSSPTTPATAAAEPLVFEVSAIKPNNSGSGNSSSNTNNGRFTATNVTLKNLIQYEAYDIPASRILGGPKWLDSTRFDVEAKTDSDTTEQLGKVASAERRRQTQAMFQQLLADRFQLKVHWETRELPIYTLAVAKNGPKLQPTAETNGHSGTSVNGNGSSVDFKTTGLTLQQFAQSLTSSASRELGREVVDKTGIAGRYDITLHWASENGAAPSSDSAQDSGPSLFTAIQEQIGLKLEPGKGPVQVLVIDHAEMPSEN
jgi:uncharacterized protein (TIGR03435 family)